MIEQLVEKWMPVIKQAEHIWTWTGHPELAYLCELASKSNYGAEFGVYMGASSFVMLKANPHLHLWTCDPFMVAGTEKVTRYFLREEIAAGRCEIIAKYSRDASDQLSHMVSKLDFVFIDDGHAKTDVLLDIECWLPLVRLGGLLCGHDYSLNPINEVAQAVQEKLAGHYSPVPNMWAYVK